MEASPETISGTHGNQRYLRFKWSPELLRIIGFRPSCESSQKWSDNCTKHGDIEDKYVIGIVTAFDISVVDKGYPLIVMAVNSSVFFVIIWRLYFIYSRP